NGFFETYTYNKLNQIIEKKDKKQVSTYYTYDYVGNVLRETTGTKSISYEYNDNSKLTKVIDANNNTTTYDYDDLGNLTKITYPDQNHMTYEYDKLGNLTKKVDPNGTIVTNTYDSQNRLTHRAIQTGTDVLGVTSENYTYDALGRLLTATDSEGNDLTFAYDSLSRLTSEINGGKQVNYTYDDNGNNTSIGDVNYTYDTLNRLESVKNGTESIANYNYDSLNLLSQTLGNGVQTNYTYDTLNRLESIGHPELVSGSSNSQLFHYSYDPNSNITSNGSDSYTYDNLNQLTKANYSAKLVNKNSNTYQYDLMGNRKYETQTRINKNGNPVNKVFAYTKNTLNQYQDRLVYTGAT
ncbi:hypothetical protein EOM39_07935, partial [Candidatus Gracilibacteria bacterium]|nr:hypothetical protein [Candidatus Gracilibacteria bacterium]